MALFPLKGSADLAARINSYDWAATALGPAEAWPDSLRTALGIILGSRFPMQLLWGPEYIHFYNDAYIVIAGDKHPAALGRPGAEVWPEIWDSVRGPLESVRASGEPSWSDDQLLVLDRNGMLEEGYFTFSYSPVRDEHGGVGGVFVAVAETTRRVIAERRLHTIRDLGASLAGQLDEAAVLAAAEGVLSRNPHDLPFALYYSLDGPEAIFRRAWAYGLPPGHPLAPARFGPDDPRWLAAATRLDGQPHPLEDLRGEAPPVLAPPWGIPVAGAVRLPIRPSPTAPPAGCLLVGISPRLRLDADYGNFLERLAAQIAAAVGAARAHAQANQALRIRDDFLSIAAHELKTPLTPVVGRLMLTRRRLAREGIAQHHLDDLERISSEANRLADMIDVLLDVTQLRSGQLTIDRRPVDLAVVAAAVIADFQLAPGKHSFSLSRPEEPAALTGDPVRLAQVVRNLVGNAVKYSPAGGAISLELARRGGAVTLAVRDEGLGIAPELLPRIFERYYRVDSAASAGISGLGIGLFVVHEIVRLHGGTIAVESTPGEGSRFTVTLPIAGAAPATAAEGPPEGADRRRRLRQAPSPK